MEEVMPKNITITDRIEVPSQRSITDAGQMIVPCTFARTGIQQYTAAQLGLHHLDPNMVVSVQREEKEVFDEESMRSFRSSPLTLKHPVKDGEAIHVTAENSKEFQVGFLEGLPIRDEDYLKGTIVVTDKFAIDAIEEGTQELSAGYTCDVVMEKSDDGNDIYFQRNIRANHIAIVDKGRAGPGCRIADSSDTDDDKRNEEYSRKVQELTDELQGVKDALEDTKAEVSEVKKLKEVIGVSESGNPLKIEDWQRYVAKEVDERCVVIEKAKDLTDLSDFKDKTIQEIKTLVVADCLPDLKVEDKSEAYINARFDVLVEDADGTMKKILKKDINQDVPKQKDPVKEARLRMINRNKGNS